MGAPDTAVRCLEDPVTPEMNLYLFFKQVVGEVDPLQREILESLVGAGTSRGWFPTVASLVERFSEHEAPAQVEDAVARLRRLRLLYADAEGRVTSVIGGITSQRTAFRAMSEDHVPFHLLGALDALTIAPMLQKRVEVETTCALTGTPLRFAVDASGTLTDTRPQTLTAFIAGWDGAAPIPEAVAANSHCFADDEALRRWQAAHGDPEGMPLTQDTLRSVGMEMAVALAELYTRMSIR